MEEIWYKFWEYKGNQSKQWIPGDIIYISNYGNVRLNDIALTIGNGLYMDSIGNINIVGLTYGKYKTIYRFIYTMAVDNTFNGGHQWQIHHIDRDHSNNRYDNLIKVTGKEHLKLHQCDFMDNNLMNRLNTLKEYYKEQSSKRSEHIATFKEWLRNRYTKYYNEILLPQKKQQRDERKQQRQIEIKARKQQKQQEKLLREQQLIDAGTHFRAKNGRLMSYEQLHNMHAADRDLSYMRSDEYRQLCREKTRQAVAEGKVIGKRKDPKLEQERREKIRKAMMGKQNALKNKDKSK